MILIRLLLSLLLTTSLLFCYVDTDIDGVEDKNDLCPNTSFDELVDKDGCPLNKQTNYLGTLTLQINNAWQMDDNNSFSNYGFGAYYLYHNWSFALSNAEQTTLDSNNQSKNYTGDLYLNMGYRFNKSDFQTKVSIGSKIAIANENIGTGENDYFSTLSLNYLADDNLALFCNLTYTLVGNSTTTNYQNSLAYGLGIGYLFTPKWYTSLSYNRADSIYLNSIDYQSLSWYNSYTINSDYFIGLNYGYGLDELSFNHTLTLSLGATFE